MSPGWGWVRGGALYCLRGHFQCGCFCKSDCGLKMLSVSSVPRYSCDSFPRVGCLVSKKSSIRLRRTGNRTDYCTSCGFLIALDVLRIRVLRTTENMRYSCNRLAKYCTHDTNAYTGLKPICRVCTSKILPKEFFVSEFKRKVLHKGSF